MKTIQKLEKMGISFEEAKKYIPEFEKFDAQTLVGCDTKWLIGYPTFSLRYGKLIKEDFGFTRFTEHPTIIRERLLSEKNDLVQGITINQNIHRTHIERVKDYLDSQRFEKELQKSMEYAMRSLPRVHYVFLERKVRLLMLIYLLDGPYSEEECKKTPLT